MKFLDEAKIKVKAGDGGSGAKHFRREKFVPFGGPDGGNGGHGGDVILIGDEGKHTLIDFQFQPEYKAKSGESGGGNRRTGKSGDPLKIYVPIGTEVIEMESDILIADITEHNQEFILAKGGRGGKGNDFFKSATNQVPEHFQPGEPGEEKEVRLSLKLIAEVGLIGFPNAGKSTLISRISSAKPKIADYPFTTLVPNLGVVKTRTGRNFVIADIPGLIPGAHEGKGLGHAFLKHVERTKVLVHLIDPFQPDPEGNTVDPIISYEQINFELESFSDLFSKRPQIVVLTKADAYLKEDLDEIMNNFSLRGIKPSIISSASGEGLNELIDRILEYL